MSPSIFSRTKALALAFLACSVVVEGFRMPDTPDDDDIGRVDIELTDFNRSGEGQQARDLMVSITYPARRAERNERVKEFTPGLASLYAREYNVSVDDVLDIETRAFFAPRYRDMQRPIILFSPGYGVSRLLYSSLAAHLASLGWTTVSIDHTGEPPVVEFPDGRIVYRPRSFSNTPDYAQQLEIRRRDITFVLEKLQTINLVQVIPDFKPFNASQVGIFGHSLGGATAANMVVTDDRFTCGANLDGVIRGEALTRSTDKPFLTMNSEGHNRTNDASLETFSNNLRGFNLEVTVAGTTHLSFTDAPAIVDGLDDLDREETNFGTINGARILDIQAAYLDALFDRCYRNGDAEILEAENKAYEEVVFVE